jgi:hypothetical protein
MTSVLKQVKNLIVHIQKIPENELIFLKLFNKEKESIFILLVCDHCSFSKPVVKQGNSLWKCVS